MNFAQSKKILILLIIYIIINCLTEAFGQNTGSVFGRIADIENKALLNVNIFLEELKLGTITNLAGNYQIKDLKSGQYTLQFTLIGYRTVVRENIIVNAGHETRLDIIMDEEPILMQEVTVTPGTFSIAQTQTSKNQAILKEEIIKVPATLDDICRILQIMPGVCFSDDFSAHFHVRGGKQDENLILLDGIEIYDPYHLKHIGGAVGVINMNLVDDVAILTGGFPAQYGDKLASVVSITSQTNTVKNLSGKITGGGTGASFMLKGPLPQGSFNLSIRKSFLKEAAEILNPTEYTFSPSFYDSQGSAILKPGKNHQISFNYLYSKDKSYLEKWHQDEDLHSDYGNFYSGVKWQNILYPTLTSTISISHGSNFWNNQIGSQRNEKLELRENNFSWDCNFMPGTRNDFEFGASWKAINYDYALKTDTLTKSEKEVEKLVEAYYGDSNTNHRTYKFAGYFQDKIKISNTFSTNFGVRYDYFEYNQDSQWSPRIGVAWTLFPNTIIRSAWGYYYQAPVYTELTKEKGSANNPKAKKSVHYLIGIEHFFNNRLNLRVEGYYKTLERMIGHYIAFDEENNAELRYGNPYSGKSQGMEFFLNGKITKKISLWMSYSYSQTLLKSLFVNWEKEILEEKTIPRFTDQPHNFAGFLTWKFRSKWELSLKWRYLSGIPYTPRYEDWNSSGKPYWKTGEVYSARFPAYHRLDFRLNRQLKISSFKLNIFLEIKNVYNHQNILLYDYRIVDNKHIRKTYHTLPFLPTIEFSFEF